MEGISDLRITGIDETRPPKVRKEPYIDVVFKLTHQAPMDWCNIFNDAMAKHAAKPKIKEEEGLFIETWVRAMEGIAPLLKQLKQAVAEVNRKYIERIELSTRTRDDANASSKESGEQGRLNKIVAELEFDDA